MKNILTQHGTKCSHHRHMGVGHDEWVFAEYALVKQTDTSERARARRIDNDVPTS